MPPKSAVEDFQNLCRCFEDNKLAFTMKMDQADLRARVDAQDNKIASQDIKIAWLEDRVSSLMSSLDAYKLSRNRFISTFKRDKLANATQADRTIIGEGNACIWVHRDDADVDASLYTGLERRRDPSVYERLYGMDPLRVLSINHKPTVDVLNFHAGIISSKHLIGTRAFYTGFGEFIKLFKESDYDESYLDDGGTTGVTRAYWSFLRCVKEEVRDVKGRKINGSNEVNLGE